MKVAFFLTNFPTISETFILNQITGLIDLGINFDIYASANPKEGKVHPQVEQYKLLEGAYYSDSLDPIFKRLTRGVKIVLKNFYKNPLAYTEVIKSRSLRDLFYVNDFVTNKSKKSYDLIHAHYGSNGLIGAILKEAGVFRGKLITSFYGYDMSSFINEKGENVYKKLFKHGDLFLPIVDFWKEKLVDMDCSKDKIVVHRIGINVDEFKFKERKLGCDGVKIITIARLAEKKGLEYSIKAVANLIRTNLGLKIEYIIIGEGPLRKNLENLLLEEGMNNNIKLLGRMNQSEIKYYMDDADIFILSSVTALDGDTEGTPTVLMEAQACGLPVVSTRHSGIPEVVLDGKSGFLVPERDVDALSEKLDYLIRNPELWLEMGRYGRKFVEERYDIQKLNQRLVKIYEAILTDDGNMLESI
ncbi:MAG TPA: glycosyltransferase [Thermodesulfobacteriota bacterium]|nr:glycosyltransferase [Thermodesulfobacteriota bacterium]